jgi:hypothetical protein
LDGLDAEDPSIQNRGQQIFHDFSGKNVLDAVETQELTGASAAIG